MAIRKRNDFILSILSFAIGLFLFASESTVSGVMLFVGLPFLAWNPAPLFKASVFC